MPFELIVQSAFTERLENNRVRIRSAGEHITDPDEIATVKASYGIHVVQVWVDDPPPAPVQPDPVPEAKPAEAATPTPEPSPAEQPAAH